MRGLWDKLNDFNHTEFILVLMYSVCRSVCIFLSCTADIPDLAHVPA